MERMQQHEHVCPENGAYGHEEAEPGRAGEMRPHGKHPHGHGPEERRGGARLTAYFLLCVICNFLLAVYALYAVGLTAQLSGDMLAAGQRTTLAESVYQLLLLVSPLLLTILLNRLLYRAMHGRRRRFPRWAAPIACVVIVLVQAATILLIFRLFGTLAAPDFAIDTIAALTPQA